MAKLKNKLWMPLRAGDTVEVVAPGFATTDERVHGAVNFLKQIGLKPRVLQDLFGPDVICSNTDEKRLAHLTRALLAKDSQAIWCLRGGYGALRIIESVAKIKKPQTNKLFVGYSDATTLHNYFNQFWHFATLHGPLLDRLGEHNLPLDQVNELIEVVFGNRDKVFFNNLQPLNKWAEKKSNIKSTVVGGNLKVVESHLGTRFAKSHQGEILFF